nr:zinc finger, CCHC-type [Tanacetum cinerariifolium]
MAKKLTSLNFTNWYRSIRIVLKYEKKMKFMEQPIGPAPDPETAGRDTIDKYYEFVNLKQEVACLMLSSYAMPNELGVSLILNSLNKDYDQTVQNYNMHNIRKTLADLHVMLKLHKKGIPKKAETLAVLAIRKGKIQKDSKKPQGPK